MFVCVYVHIYFTDTLIKENNVLLLNEQLRVVCYCYDDQEATTQISSAENFNHKKQRGGGRN